MFAEIQQLESLVTAMSPLPADDMKRFLSLWQPYTAKRKVTLTQTGDTEQYLYFVLSGVQRVFYADDKGREATLVFTYNPSFGGVLDSLLEKKPSAYMYETLTESRFLRARYSEMEDLMLESSALSVMVRKGVVNALSGVFERLIELQCFSSEDKFRSLMKRSPHILKLIPHKYLANYLGIDPSNFSKFINTIVI